MPLDIYAALSALIRAEATRETAPVTDAPLSGEPECVRLERDDRGDTGPERK
jgi:hypothetical protein